MKAANFHNVWTPTPSRFEFIIEPHFYETPAFYVSCGLFLIGLTVAIQAYRLRWQRRLMRVEQQRALDSERTRIARDLHDEMGTALTGLGLQLDLLGRGVALGSTLSERLKAAAQSTRKLAERMREVVWAVNPKCELFPAWQVSWSNKSGNSFREIRFEFTWIFRMIFRLCP